MGKSPFFFFLKLWCNLFLLALQPCQDTVYNITCHSFVACIWTGLRKFSGTSNRSFALCTGGDQRVECSLKKLYFLLCFIKAVLKHFMGKYFYTQSISLLVYWNLCSPNFTTTHVPLCSPSFTSQLLDLNAPTAALTFFYWLINERA